MNQIVGMMLVAAIFKGAVRAKDAFTQFDERQECSADAMTTSNPRRQFAQMISKPSNPIELLENIKLAATNEMLVRDEFYVDQNLKTFFGGQKVIWRENEGALRTVEVRELGELFEHSIKYPGMGAAIYRKVQDKAGNDGSVGKMSATFVIDTAHDSRLTAESVERIFGATREISDPYKNDNPSHPRPITRSTHPLGNKMMSYAFDSPKAVTSVWLLLNGDGTVQKLVLMQEEK